MGRTTSWMLLLAAGCAMLAGCASAPVPGPGPAYAWVEAGADGDYSVRAIVDSSRRCPVAQLDGALLPLHRRAGLPEGAARVPSTTTVDAPGGQVCEARVPHGARDLYLGTQRLPVPVTDPARIVVIGDSGCRIVDGLVQSCNDPVAWPFAHLAAQAAALHPQLVIHVGDYHYREAACPSGNSGCAGSPWGYGWDVWRADFFEPAAPLLAAAPWVVVRGNHEECARAGQGWFRLLAPEPYTRQRSCDDPGNDDDADYTAPYAVPLTPALQLVVFDSAVAGNAPLDPAKPRDARTRAMYAQQMRDVASLAARPGVRTWFLSHHPVLAFAPNGRGGVYPGNPALQQAMRDTMGPGYFPAGVDLALHGHVHLFQAIGFLSDEPATVLAGNGGDWLDAELPAGDLTKQEPAPGVRIAQITHSSRFGFLLLERVGADAQRWRLTAFDTKGGLLAACSIGPGRALDCGAH